MKTLACLLLILLTRNAAFSQCGLEHCFTNGRTGYTDFIHKQARYPASDRRTGRYGLCLVSFSLTRDNDVKNIRVLSSPSKTLTAEAARLIRLTEHEWIFPGSASADSLNFLAGFYFIKAGDDRSSTRTGTRYSLPALRFDEVYKEYTAAGFLTNPPESFEAPFCFIGIVTIVGPGISRVE